MLEKLEAKTAEYVEKILSKEDISLEEYQVLVSEIYRIKTEQKQKELDAANKEHRDALKAQMTALFN